MKELRPSIASRQELLELLTDAARRGRVSAMERLLVELRRDEAPPTTETADDVDDEVESALGSVIADLTARREDRA